MLFLSCFLLVGSQVREPPTLIKIPHTMIFNTLKSLPLASTKISTDCEILIPLSFPLIYLSVYSYFSLNSHSNDMENDIEENIKNEEGNNFFKHQFLCYNIALKDSQCESTSRQFVHEEGISLHLLHLLYYRPSNITYMPGAGERKRCWLRHSD